MATSNKKSNTKKDRIAEPITPETRAEKINKLVEEDAKTFDAQEEKFLETPVAEIEAQPVVEEFVEIPGEEELIEEPTIENKWEKSGLLEGLTGNVNEEATKLFESPLSEIINEPCTCDENCDCKKSEATPEPCACEKPCECEKPEEIKEVLEKYHNIDAEAELTKLLEAEAPKFQLGQQIQKLAEVDIEPTPVAPVTAPRVKKTFAQMTACEMNIYNKTGIIPFV